MSFYGNVFYSYSNAFKNQIYENVFVEEDKWYDGRPSQSESSESLEYTVSPTGRDDAIRLKAGNKWIRFYANSDDAEARRVQIYHRIATKDSYGTFTDLTPSIYSGDNVSGAVDLGFGNILTIPQISFDNAGHIVSSQMINVHMPVPEGTEDIRELKRRIAQLEEYITGSHLDNGEQVDPQTGTQPDPEDWTAVNPQQDTMNLINSINEKIAEWELKIPNGSYNEYKEVYGIGTTLHELMVLVGTRIKNTYDITVDGVTTTYEGYQVNNSGTYNSGTILGDLQNVSAGIGLIPYIVDSLNNAIDWLNSDAPGAPNLSIEKIKRL